MRLNHRTPTFVPHSGVLPNRDALVTDGLLSNSIVEPDTKPTDKEHESIVMTIRENSYPPSSTAGKNSGVETQMEDDSSTPVNTEMYEFEIDLADLEKKDTFQIKPRNDVYYKLYKEAKRKAKEAKLLALSNYLEAKRLKTTYLLEDSSDSSDEEDEDMEEEDA